MKSSTEKRETFLPVIAECFANNGFRGTTTARLAEACGVRENVLYRIWPSKKEMFLDCIEHIYNVTMTMWKEVNSDESVGRSRAEQILSFQAKDHGLLRYYRLVFAAMLEDDADIRKSLRNLYRRFQSFLADATKEHREENKTDSKLDDSASAWALMGLAAMVDIQRELRISSTVDRENFLVETGLQILNGFNAETN